LPFELTILGSNSAIPIHGRNHTAQHLRIQNHHFLIDCGEGAQLQLQKYGLKSRRLEAIFISHLHGDHYLGLLGLLSSMHL
jgi:ribonuclease Z